MKTLYFLIVVPALCFGQSAVTPEDRQKASDFYTAGDWPNAIGAYQKIADSEPQNWNARNRLGASLIASGKAKEAIKPLEDAVTIGKSFQPMYQLAIAYAATHQADQAFHWLGESVQYGFAQLSVFDDDKYLQTLKADARYTAVRESILRAIYPCRYTDHARDFDFWIGEWDVKNVQGAPAGHSKIEVMLGDCIIFENWTSAPPNLYSGKSFNLYNPTTRKWMQTWVDDKGGVLEFINGEYKDNKMIFVTRSDPKNQITRLTFYNLRADLVRQVFETTSDDGKTWTTTSDLQYHRVK